MKIGIDIRCLIDGKRTGVEEYTTNLLKAVFELDKKNCYVLFCNSFTEPKADFSWVNQYPNVKIKRFRFPNKLLNLCFWYFSFPKIDRMIGGVDLFFMPNINFGAFSSNTNLILTVHDLSFEFYPETFSFKRRLWHALVNPKRLCMKASKIIAVSHSTKDDLVQSYNIPHSKVFTIHSGVSDAFRQVNRNEKKLLEVKNKYKLPYRFILFLGTIEPRKNILTLVKAFDHLKKTRHPQVEKMKLILAGAKGWKYEKIFREIRKTDCRKDVFYTDFIEEDDKPYLYNLASIFVYPSLFEGFGFPVLEAMKCGAPVITSACTSFPEIVGQSAVMVDPERPQDLFAALRELLTEEKKQSSVSTGLSCAAKYSWAQAAQETVKLFRASKQ